MTARRTETRPIHVREIVVSDVRDVSPGMRRVGFTGPGLRAHSYRGMPVPVFESMGFDDDVRLVFPDPVTGSRPRPEPDGRGGYAWTHEARNLGRAYTVRAWDGRAGRLVIDFARHEAGLAEDWVAHAVPGDALWMAGPRTCSEMPHAHDRLILVGDATALPAMERAVETASGDHDVTVICAVPDGEYVPRTGVGAYAGIHWVRMDRGEDVVAVLGRLGIDRDRTYLWGAGESGMLRRVRAAAKAAGLGREDSEFTGYWRRRSAAGETLPLPALQLLDAIGTRPADAGAAADAAGLSADQAVLALRLLWDRGLVTEHEGCWVLTEAGRERADG